MAHEQERAGFRDVIVIGDDDEEEPIVVQEEVVSRDWQVSVLCLKIGFVDYMVPVGRSVAFLKGLIVGDGHIHSISDFNLFDIHGALWLDHRILEDLDTITHPYSRQPTFIILPKRRLHDHSLGLFDTEMPDPLTARSEGRSENALTLYLYHERGLSAEELSAATLAHISSCRHLGVRREFFPIHGRRERLDPQFEYQSLFMTRPQCNRLIDLIDYLVTREFPHDILQQFPPDLVGYDLRFSFPLFLFLEFWENNGLYFPAWDDHPTAIESRVFEARSNIISDYDPYRAFVILRRTTNTRNRAIGWHCEPGLSDDDHNTVDVALNDASEYGGGESMFITPRGECMEPLRRTQGDVIIYQEPMLRGVCPVSFGTRYSLCIVQEEYLTGNEMNMVLPLRDYFDGMAAANLPSRSSGVRQTSSQSVAPRFSSSSSSLAQGSLSTVGTRSSSSSSSLAQGSLSTVGTRSSSSRATMDDHYGGRLSGPIRRSSGFSTDEEVRRARVRDRVSPANHHPFRRLVRESSDRLRGSQSRQTDLRREPNENFSRNTEPPSRGFSSLSVEDDQRFEDEWNSDARDAADNSSSFLDFNDTGDEGFDREGTFSAATNPRGNAQTLSELIHASTRPPQHSAVPSDHFNPHDTDDDDDPEPVGAGQNPSGNSQPLSGLLHASSEPPRHSDDRVNDDVHVSGGGQWALHLNGPPTWIPSGDTPIPSQPSPRPNPQRLRYTRRYRELYGNSRMQRDMSQRDSSIWGNLSQEEIEENSKAEKFVADRQRIRQQRMASAVQPPNGRFDCDACTICMEPGNVCLQMTPCGHVCYCDDVNCENYLLDERRRNECPICRKVVVGYRRVQPKKKDDGKKE